jgi:hypothetical protein
MNIVFIYFTDKLDENVEKENKSKHEKKKE